MTKFTEKLLLSCFACLLPFSAMAENPNYIELTEEQEKICNPSSMEDDILISGPNGTCYSFRPVSVKGNTPFEGVSFIMGDAENDSFRTLPTKVMIGGSFQDEVDESLWKYYLGKYEVTQGQYLAIMGKLPAAHGDKEPNPAESNLPITNLTYFEALMYIDKLNLWLYENVMDEIPTSGSYPGFVRLPSEIEWEFASRGGIAVEPSLFEAPNPYDDEFTKHEWFAGPTSSHGKIKPIGQLAGNPLGLHDMLGNVQEMTYSPYKVRYFEGGSGGFVSRGGSYITNEDNLSSAQRQEEPYYLLRREKLSPNAKLTLGLRLALAAPLLTGRDAISNFEDYYDENYEKLMGSGADATPAALSIAPVSAQEQVSSNDAIARIEKIRNTPQDQIVQVASQELGYIEAALRETMQIREKADADSAKIWISQAHFFAQELQLDLIKYDGLNSRVIAKEGQDDQPRWITMRDDVGYIIDKKLERYRESIAALDNLPPNLVLQALENRKKEDNEKLEKKELSEEVISNSLAALALVQNHYDQFTKSKRADIKAWRENFNNNIKN